MIVLDPVALAAIFALPVTLTSFALFRAARAARRNREDRCGTCDGPLYAPGARAGPSLLQGRLICEPCAARERRHLRRGLIAGVSISAVTILALAAVAIWAPDELGAHPWLPVVAASIEYPALFAGAIAWMKRMNRRATERLGLPSTARLEPPPTRPAVVPAGGRAQKGDGRADA